MKRPTLALGFVIATIGAPLAIAQSAPGPSQEPFNLSSEISGSRQKAQGSAIQEAQKRAQERALAQQRALTEAQIAANKEVAKAQIASQQAVAEAQIEANQESFEAQLEAEKDMQQAELDASRMRFSSAPDGSMSVALPSGGGLVPGGSSGSGGDTNYVINIQNGDGNVASNTTVETEVTDTTTIIGNEF